VRLASWALSEFGYVDSISEALVEFDDDRLKDFDLKINLSGVEVGESNLEGFTDLLNHDNHKGTRHILLPLKKVL